MGNKKNPIHSRKKKSQSNNNPHINYSEIYLTKNRYKVSEENKNSLSTIKAYIYRQFIFGTEDSIVKDANSPYVINKFNIISTKVTTEIFLEEVTL